jgi:hypothetical protein
MGAPVLYPPARYRPVRNRSGVMVQPTRGLIAHVQVGNGSLFGWFDNPQSQVSAHLWLSRAGEFEQYVPFDQRAWAQAAGNPYWISCECEGRPDEDYTAAQIRGLGQLFAWGIQQFGWKAEITDSPDGYGLGTHRMGGAAWGGHECPGPIRAGRRGDILAAALDLLHPTPPAPAVPEDDMPSPSQWTAEDWKAWETHGALAFANLLTAQMRQLVTTDPDSGQQVRMADVHLGSLGEALGLLVLRSSFAMRRDGAFHDELVRIGDHLGGDGPLVQWTTKLAGDVAAVRQQLGPATPAAPLTLDDLSAALNRLDALDTARLMQAAGAHLASLVTPTPSGGS